MVGFTHEPGHVQPSSASSDIVWWVRTEQGWDFLHPTWTTILEQAIQTGCNTSAIFHSFAHGRRGTNYDFDFAAMTQTNRESGKVRPILRTVVAPPPLGAGHGQAPSPAGAPAQASGETPPQPPAQAGAAPPSAKPQGRAAQLPEGDEVLDWFPAANDDDDAPAGLEPWPPWPPSGAPTPAVTPPPPDDDENWLSTGAPPLQQRPPPIFPSADRLGAAAGYTDAAEFIRQSLAARGPGYGYDDDDDVVAPSSPSAVAPAPPMQEQLGDDRNPRGRRR